VARQVHRDDTQPVRERRRDDAPALEIRAAAMEKQHVGSGAAVVANCDVAAWTGKRQVTRHGAEAT